MSKQKVITTDIKTGKTTVTEEEIPNNPVPLELAKGVDLEKLKTVLVDAKVIKTKEEVE